MFRGSPVPSARWFRDGIPIFDSSEAYDVFSDGNGSSVLTVKCPSEEDSGVFTCLLENLVGAVKTSANLSVVAGDEDGVGGDDDDGGDDGQYLVSASTVTTRTLKEMTVREGDTIRFDIQFRDGDREQLRFRKDGQDLPVGDDRFGISVEGEVAALTISRAEAPGDSGTYECIMRTAGGEARVQVKVHVKAKEDQA